MKSTILLQASLLAYLIGSTAAFVVSQKTILRRTTAASSSVVSLGAAKGFGGDTEGSTKKKKSRAPVAESVSTSSAPERPVELNAGQKALAEMRRQKAEEKDAELRRVRELLQTDKQVQKAPATIPEDVAQRMGKRMLPFVGLPLFLGMGAFVAFWYLAVYQNMEFQPALVAGSTIGILVLGLLGITYSVMSASWDPEREGSFLGTEEFKRNVDNIKEGLGRSRENALLRDKMSGLSEDELQSALADLDRRESSDAKRQQSLKSKLNDELE